MLVVAPTTTGKTLVGELGGITNALKGAKMIYLSPLVALANQKYEEFKRQLYEKSLADSLKCFEYFIELNSHHDANICLQTWKMHAKEIDLFDESTYEEYVKRLKSLKEKPPEQTADSE